MQHVNHFLSLPLDLHAELCRYAQLRGMSLSDILFESIVTAAEEHRFHLEAHSVQRAFHRAPELLCA